MKENVQHLFIALLVLLGLPLLANAQNVTISPGSGELIAALTYDNEVGFENGWSAMWHHNQLPLTLVVSDKSDLTEGGRLKDPAGNIILDKSQGLYVIGSGTSVSLHMNISLPKGYRFTGYRMVLLNNKSGSVGGLDNTAQTKRLYETGSDFDINNYKAATPEMPATTSSTQEYVIERTSKTPTDMTNQLYFYFDHSKNGYYSATLKYCELFFTADGAFTEEVTPTENSQIIADGKNIVGAPFKTDKLDLGVIKPNTKNGSTYLSYDYRNVTDLVAYNYIYQSDAVTADKKLPETAGSGKIQSIKNGDHFYYALGNDTYYVETPTSTKTQDNVVTPLGYRIVGATINYNYGKKSSESSLNYDIKRYTISATTGMFSTTTYYLQTDGTWKKNNKVYWENDNGRLKSGNNYLYVYKSTQTDFWGNEYYIYYLYSTTDVSQASTFTFDEANKHILYEGLYVYMESSRANAQLSNSSYADLKIENITGTATNPAFTPGNYTLKVYGTDKDNAKETVEVTSGKSGTIELTDLNNDAVKFSVEGLPEGSKALVQVSLTLEALNPFINSLDIVCHSYIPKTPTLAQQFTSNDFQVAGGEFKFYVPSEFIGEQNKCYFTFDNLFSKYGDKENGYPESDASSHHARYFFVKSSYWENVAGDGKQYNAQGNEMYDTKSSTTFAGTQPFKYSNIADLSDGSSTATTALEEYPFSETLYKDQGGSFVEKQDVEVNGKKSMYLFTGDETKYNIAPTTALEHRYFAYYEMIIDLLVKDYRAECELTPIYTTTCYNGDGELKELPMYGGKFVAYDTETNEKMAAGQAYLTVPAMATALSTALHNIDQSYSGKQVLYLDYTDMYSVHLPDKEAMDAMKAKLNPNCLFYFPATTFWNDDNFAQLQLSGNFRACRNIVLTDKQPFYAPYRITVPAENYAQYTREITVPKNGKVALATVMLPFTMETTEGLHTNRDDECSFTINTMKTDNCINLTTEELETPQRFNQQMQFSPISGTSEANKPYMIKVEKAPTDENISFIAQQYGSDVMPTTQADGMDASDYTFTGETATGTLKGATYTFTNYGSYAGKKLEIASNDVFYFSGGMYLNIHNLNKSLQTLKVVPFRAYYEYQTTSGAKAEAGFNVSFNDPTVTDITVPRTAVSDLTVHTGHGYMTLTANADRNVRIVNVAGGVVTNVSLTAGEQQTITLPAGIYIINKVKIIVK